MKPQNFLLKHKAAPRQLHLVDVRHFAGKVDIRGSHVSESQVTKKSGSKQSL